MRVEMVKAPADSPVKRIYRAAATLKGFRQREAVEVQLFRIGAPDEEIAACKGRGLVGEAPEDMPREVLAGATEEAALACLMEAFTEEEAQEMRQYLEKRYSGQITRLAIGPMDLPVPLGVGPLAKIPESANAGFINFDHAPGYPLNFAFRGYYDLDDQEE